MKYVLRCYGCVGFDVHGLDAREGDAKEECRFGVLRQSAERFLICSSR